MDKKKIPDKKLQKAISGKAQKKSKNEIVKFRDMLIPEDRESIKQTILLDVVVPAIKNIISDVVESILHPGEGRRSRGRPKSSMISYSSIYDEPRKKYDYNRKVKPNQGRIGYDYEDVILETRGDAEYVLRLLGEALDTYGIVSVADLYDLVDVSSSYTDHNYGWTNISTADIISVREGYLIKMPKAIPIT